MTDENVPAKQPRPKTSVGMIVLLVIVGVAILSAIVYFAVILPAQQEQADYNEQVSNSFCQMAGC